MYITIRMIALQYARNNNHKRQFFSVIVTFSGKITEKTLTA